MVTGTELTTTQTALDVQFNDTHLSTLRTTARLFAASGMFPDAKSEAQAFVKIMAGRELGLPAMISMTKIYIVEGKVTVGAEIMAAKVKASKHYNYKVTKHDNTICTIEFYRDGQLDYTSTFTIEDARTAGLIKPNGGWVKWPRAMLFSKSMSQGARIVCPEEIDGVYTPEDFGIDVDDEGKPKDIGRVTVIVDNPVTVDEVTGEVIGGSDDPAKDLSQGSHVASSGMVDQAPKGICPVHQKPFVDGKWGWHCKCKVGEGWCKEKPKAMPVMSKEEVQDYTDSLYESPTQNADSISPDQEADLRKVIKESGRTLTDVAGYIKDTLKWEGIKNLADLKVYQYEQLKQHYIQVSK